ncbi:MAG: TetR/AcrR family transcriptional regulator [Marmoricola sp.]
MARVEVATREQLLDAAARILAQDGLAGLSTRRLANELGVSTMVVYTRFGSMSELIDAVIAEGFERQADRLQQVRESKDPKADLVALGEAYRANALEHRHLYAIMYAESEDPAHRKEQAKGTFDLFSSAAARAIDAGLISAADPAVVAGQVWSAVHGLVSLELAGVLEGKSAAGGSVRTMLGALLDGPKAS